MPTFSLSIVNSLSGTSLGSSLIGEATVSSRLRLAIAARQAGEIAVVDATLAHSAPLIEAAICALAAHGTGGFALKLSHFDPGLEATLGAWQEQGLEQLILDAEAYQSSAYPVPALSAFRAAGGQILLEIRRWEVARQALEAEIDGWWLKGQEAPGLVEEETSLILLQQVLCESSLPLHLRGGIGLHSAAAAMVLGAAGVVLDSQLLLLPESPLPASLKALLQGLNGTECSLFGREEQGLYLRLLSHPALPASKDLEQALAQASAEFTAAELEARLLAASDWKRLAEVLLPMGQDVAYASEFAARYGRLSRLLRAYRRRLSVPLSTLQARALAAGSPLAEELGTRYPIVQGAMTRVSDVPAFSLAVAESGALPVTALALLAPERVQQLLTETSALLGDRAWGVGLLGFADRALREQHFELVKAARPRVAYIAGGRPEQAKALEACGIKTFLHVPTRALLRLFLQQDVRRFIVEGRECGGHIGPLGSAVLWNQAIDTLLEFQASGGDLSEVSLLFAGGVHDAASAAMVAALAAPITEAGARIGVLVGTAYLFTREAVESGAIVPLFQRTALACDKTAAVTTGLGHASRCARTTFIADFHAERTHLLRRGADRQAISKVLEPMTLGRLRIATKGVERAGDVLGQVDEIRQAEEGMYMIGQVAMLHDALTDCATLHRSMSDAACDRLEPWTRLSQPAFADPPTAPADIAIIGFSTLLPGATDTDAYWRNICSGVISLGEIPLSRWDWRLYYDPDQQARDRIYSKWGGFIDDIVFDPTAYGMPPRSVTAIDPMQLLALEVVRRAIAHAGVESDADERERTSVILGASGGLGELGLGYAARSELARVLETLDGAVLDRLPEWTEDSFAGLLMNVSAGRCANRFDLKGINATVDAACASSLAAVYQAVNELILHRCDLAIAGGVDTVQSPFAYLCFSKTRALSPRGRCQTFDESADGIVIAEGLATLVLKRLADARRDGDQIYAVIKGVGGSSDGRAKGLTAPHPAGQIRALQRAYAEAGYSPSSLGMVEAHGTGTVAGDRAELQTVAQVLEQAKAEPGSCAIGSVKTLIGHTKSAAGACGLIKAALALHHRILPPHVGIDLPQPILREARSPLYVCSLPRPWIAPVGHPRRAGVSAFGFGGTNFHVALEEYADGLHPRPASPVHWPTELFLWCAADRDALCEILEETAQELEVESGLTPAALAFRLCQQCAPDNAGVRLAILAEDLKTLNGAIVGTLRYLRGQQTELPQDCSLGEIKAENVPKVALLFAGQGAQYPDMHRELALYLAPLADAIARADEVLAKSAVAAGVKSPAPLSRLIFPPPRFDAAVASEQQAQLTATENAQPALGAVEAGLWSVLRSLGLQPAMVAGHSYGEFVALHAAGVLDYDQLIGLSAARGRFIAELDTQDTQDTQAKRSGMLAVRGAAEQIRQLLAEIEDTTAGSLSLANHNAPEQSVIAGRTDDIKRAREALTRAKLMSTPLRVSAGFHSPCVEPARARLAAYLDQLELKSSSMPVYHNSSAAPHSSDSAQVRSAMANHLTQPVRFVEQIERMYADGARVFLEVGPGSIQTDLVGKILGERPHQRLAIDAGRGGLHGFLRVLAKLFSMGVTLDLAPLFAGRDLSKPKLEVEPHLGIPPHAWLLNGTHLHRPGEPGRRGVATALTLADKTARAASAATSAVAEAPAPLNPVSRPSMSANRPRENARPSASPSSPPGRDQVMAEYQATMRQFLALQEQVMMDYLRGRPTMAAAVPDATSLLPAAKVQPQPMAEPSSASTSEGAPLPALPPETEAAALHGGTDAPTHSAEPALAAELQGRGEQGTSAPKAAVVAATANAITGSIAEQLLQITSERTGYPIEMLELDQEIEADLGIDSIKRVEILVALQEQLPAGIKERLGNAMDQITAQRSLRGIIEAVEVAMRTGAGEGPPEQPGATRQGANSGPFELAGAAASRAPLPRFLIEPMAEILPPVDAGVYGACTILVMGDDLGLLPELQQRLADADCQLMLIPEALYQDPEGYAVWLAERRQARPIRGFLHLGSMRPSADPEPLSAAAWRQRFSAELLPLFALLGPLRADLSEGGRLLCVSAMGGLFGRDANHLPTLAAGFSGTAALSGLVKSLSMEWNADPLHPRFIAKAVDIDPRRDRGAIADDLVAELRNPWGRREVGYPQGERTIFRSLEALLPPLNNPLPVPDSNWVVLAVGGARGITAESLRPFLNCHPHLVLVGRHPLPQAETPDIAGCAERVALQQRLLSRAKEEDRSPTPAEIESQIDGILRDREIRANLKDFQAAGAQVEYHALDMRDERAVRDLIEGIYREHGRLDAVLHGAGILRDKWLVDKDPDAVMQVIDTKVVSLLNMLPYLRADQLKLLALFTSVAGRYGNPGQTDYALANEALGRLAQILHQRWGEQVRVVAINWNPWGPTRHGTGMVSAAVRRQFEARGIQLIDADAGREVVLREYLYAPLRDVEVIAGDCPWEDLERRYSSPVSAVQNADSVSPSIPEQLPLLRGASLRTFDSGVQIEKCIDLVTDPYLDHHRIDGIPVLPLAAAAAYLGEAAQVMAPGQQVALLHDLKLFRGLKLASTQNKIYINGRCDKADSVRLSLFVDDPKRGPHYQAQVEYRAELAEPPHYQLPAGLALEPLSITDAYRRWLFHGPLLQTIEQIDGVAPQHLLLRIRPTQPNALCPSAESGQWVLDPGLIDGALQGVLIWSRYFHDRTPLPARVGRIQRYANSGSCDSLQCHIRILSAPDAAGICCDIAFFDTDQRLRLLLSEVEATASRALNRIAVGWAGGEPQHSHKIE